jgi:hypothetical protein
MLFSWFGPTADVADDFDSRCKAQVLVYKQYEFHCTLWATQEEMRLGVSLCEN